MTKLLEVTGLQVELAAPGGWNRIVDGIDVSLHAGKTLGVVGESGSGKSITSLSIMGLLPKGLSRISAGDIQLEGQSLLALSERDMGRIRGNRIAMIFQEPMTSLNPVFTIGRQLREAIRQHRKIGRRQAGLDAVELLRKVGIPRPEQVVKEYPHQLSGGMRQRVMIAMSMACDPQILIADEPTTALDVTIQAQILDLMRQLQRESGTAILFITHDLAIVAEMCDRVAVMYAGQVVEEADVRDIFRDPKHPYTKGLLASLPLLSGGQQRLTPIPGQVPTPDAMPHGCRFAPRCTFKTEACERIKPAMLELDNGRRCRCLLYEEEGAR